MILVNVIYFIIFILSIAVCCQIFRCLCECMCRWADYWYDLKQEEEYRQTQIVPSPPPVYMLRKPLTKVVPAHKYIVVMNPQGHPISLGLPKEYSNV